MYHSNNDITVKENLIVEFLVAYMVPFELGVDFDDAEVCTADTDPTTCEPMNLAEEAGNAGGILGFSLCYVQHTPPVA